MTVLYPEEFRRAVQPLRPSADEREDLARAARAAAQLREIDQQVAARLEVRLEGRYEQRAVATRETAAALERLTVPPGVPTWRGRAAAVAVLYAGTWSALYNAGVRPGLAAGEALVFTLAVGALLLALEDEQPKGGR